MSDYKFSIEAIKVNKIYKKKNKKIDALNNFNITIMIRLGLRQAQWTYIEEYEFKFNPCFSKLICHFLNQTF